MSATGGRRLAMAACAVAASAVTGLLALAISLANDEPAGTGTVRVVVERSAITTPVPARAPASAPADPRIRIATPQPFVRVSPAATTVDDLDRIGEPDGAVPLPVAPPGPPSARPGPRVVRPAPVAPRPLRPVAAPVVPAAPPVVVVVADPVAPAPAVDPVPSVVTPGAPEPGAPPVIDPPVIDPPVADHPPVPEPTVKDPPLEEPPVVQEPPVKEPPAVGDPQVKDPPVVEEPPVEDPPATGPEAADAARRGPGGKTPEGAGDMAPPGTPSGGKGSAGGCGSR